MWDAAGFLFYMRDKSSAELPNSIIIQPLVLFNAIKIPQLRPLDTNKTQFAVWSRKKFIKSTNEKQTTAKNMPIDPLCHPMTSRKITQGGRVGEKKNETVQYKISGVRSK